MDTLSTREARTVNRENSRRITTFERECGERVRRPARGNAVRAAIRASAIGF
jgi:hypothetical protein